MENNFEALSAKQKTLLKHLLTEVGFVQYDGDDFTSYWTKEDDNFYSMTEKCFKHLSSGGKPDIVGCYKDEEGTLRFGLMGMATIKMEVDW